MRGKYMVRVVQRERMTPSLALRNSCDQDFGVQTMGRIQDAPDDVVIQICQHLSVKDILAFRQVGRRSSFRAISLGTHNL